MTLPLLGLALGRQPVDALVPLLAAASRWCQPVAMDPALAQPAAILATAERVGCLANCVRMALWTRSPDEARTEIGSRMAAVVSDVPAVVDAAGERGVFASRDSGALSGRPVAPFVRERLRRARGLSDTAILAQTAAGWRWTGHPEPLSDDLVPTAMACASAVAVSEPRRVVEALAWGSPCVCDPASARQAGALPGTHLLISEDPIERLELASRLASDRALASRLSWAGWRFVEQRHDPDRAAARLVELLQLTSADPMGAWRLQLRLLGMPDGDRRADRYADATANLGESI